MDACRLWNLAIGCLGWGVGLLAAAPEWRSLPGGRVSALVVPTGGRAGFTRLGPATTGLSFTNTLSVQAAANNRILQNGSGVTLGDVDGDGWCDVFLCRLEAPNALFRNLGHGRFVEVPDAGGAACAGQFNSGVALADTDGDGDLDLLVNSIGGGTRQFFNDGRGGFTEVTNSRLVRRFGATSLALGDIDGDGDLDLYVPNYRTTTHKDRPPGVKPEARRGPDGHIVVTPADRFIALGLRKEGVEIVERGERDFLYVNQGGGNFAPVSWTAGSFLDEAGQPLTAPPTEWGLSAMLRDIDGDGWPDLYVCNDFVYWPDRIWLNNRGAGFRAAPATMFRSQSLSSMSVDMADLDRDGRDDVFTADMTTRHLAWRSWQRPFVLAGSITFPVWEPQFRPEVLRNVLHVARADGTFAEVAQFAGIAATEWTWSAVFLDVDLDGWEDLLIANGNMFDVQHADRLAEPDGDTSTPEGRLRSWSRFPALNTANLAFRNQRDLTFADVTADWGFGDVGISSAMAMADLDNDGDLDVVMNHLNGPATIHRNESAAPRVAVRLRGSGANTRGIGARITVRGGPVVQTQEMIAGGRYLSCDDAMRVFAASSGPLEIEVRWPGGQRTVMTNVPPNSLVEVVSDGAPAAIPPWKEAGEPWFEDVSNRLKHRHSDEAFDDFARQPLLPRKLSSGGPGVAWIDLNADGHDDLLVGSGPGGQVAAFVGDGRGGFAAATNGWLRLENGREQTALVGWLGTNGANVVLGQSTWRDGAVRASAGSWLSSAGLAGLPANSAATGPVVLGDANGDGRLELFIGGRTAPGRWPEAGTSMLLRQGGAGFDVIQSLTNVGMVQAAVFTDLIPGGGAELAVTTDFGPIRLLRWTGSELAPWDPAVAIAADRRVPLSSLKGLWTGIAAGDFDGDGRMDLVAGNWGRNFGEARLRPGEDSLTVWYGDFGIGPMVQPVLASLDREQGRWLPFRELRVVAGALPFIAETVTSHEAFGRMDVADLLGTRREMARHLDAVWFDTTLFLNRDDFLEARPLPREAQWAPGFGPTLADFDGDGREDVFLSQNFFGVDAETSRLDAGTGLLLFGDGRGGFRPVDPAEAGFNLPGEGRGAAVADFDGDGRMDLVVGQHRNDTVLLRNRRAEPGLRVRVQGGPENRTGLGAVLRLESKTGGGPARELHGGGGWWSQDSAMTVLARPASPATLVVRWPGGRETRHSVAPATREIVVEKPAP
jgi:enediyne biosynthesis protein E4